MKRKIEQRKCDQCKKVVSEFEGKDMEEVHLYGAFPFEGWLTVEKIDGSCCVLDLEEIGPWDFCSLKCCVKFLSKKVEK